MEALNITDLIDLEEDWYEELTSRDAAAEDDSQRFVVNNDDRAEWAIKKIGEITEKYKRLIDCCESQARIYEEKAQTFAKRRDEEISYLKLLLERYFDCLPHDHTKTQETYQLPSGKLVLKHREPEVIRDDDQQLAEWCMKNGHSDKVSYTPKIKWEELKKRLVATPTGFVTTAGEIVPGVKRESRPDTFDIKLN